VNRITAISALCLAVLAVSAGPATAATPLTFSATVQADQSVSLLASTTACRARPCSYSWRVDGVPTGMGRSLVVQLAAGCHEVFLRMDERRFRNPTAATRRAARTVCVGKVGTSTVSEISEPAEDPRPAGSPRP